MVGQLDTSPLEGSLHANGSQAVIACSVIFIISCTIILALRFLACRIAHRSLFFEDWIMLPAWALMMGLCGNAIWSVKVGGVGRHEEWVLQYSGKSMRAWAQSLFVTEFLYGLLIPIEKTSILLLYLRLFSIHHWFRYATFVMIWYIWMWGVSESIVSVAQCKPVAYQWNKGIEGTCINQLAYFRWISVPNVIHDLLMLVLPVPVVWRLQIPGQQRLALTSVFFIGSIVFIRMVNFFQLNAFSDRTWASIQLMSWTVAEPGLILICACLPAMWPLFRRLFRIRAVSNNPSRGTGKSGTSQRGVLDTPWTGHIHGGQHDVFIELNDIDDHDAAHGRISTARMFGGSATVDEESAVRSGINVTKEFSIINPP